MGREPGRRHRRNQSSHQKDGIRAEAAALGIESSYIDELGRLQSVAPHALKRLIEIMRPSRSGSTRRHHQPQERHGHELPLPPCLVLHVDRPAASIDIAVPNAPAGRLIATWSLRSETGDTEVGREQAAVQESVARARGPLNEGGRRVAVPLPQLPLGYYDATLTLHADPDIWHGRSCIIVTPSSCYLPSSWRGKKSRASRVERWWGLTVQLYGIRSRRNWGIGDFRDLVDLLKWGHSLGAAMIGVNPLHALLPEAISPYSPSSRLFHNPLYLDVESIADLREDGEIRASVASGIFQRRLERLRDAQIVDYEAVAKLKWMMLRRLYRRFRGHHLEGQTARGRRFLRFVREQGEPLARFAVFEALSRHFTKNGRPIPWSRWPPAFRHPSSAAVREFAARRQREIRFYQYVQWQCQLQLAQAARTARRLGLPIGLYTDFAVGIDPNGADAWAYQDVLVPEVSVGAPPDRFSPKGQDWGLRPAHPRRLAETAYRFFIESYRRNLQYAGLLRLDHAMNLFRLFWVPRGHPAKDGAYVTYPAEDLLGILALESRRLEVIVVGEDLGTVTPEIREALIRHGLLSYRLLLFEKTADGAFVRPRDYPVQAMAAATTHDLPTLRGFWRGRDIDQKESLGLYPGPAIAEADRKARAQDRVALVRALREAHVIGKRGPEEAHFDEELVLAAYRFLARTPCYLLAVTLEDLLGDLDPPNIPNADPSRYPVWRRKAGPSGMTIREWSDLPHVSVLAAMLRSERPLSGRRKQAAIARAS